MAKKNNIRSIRFSDEIIQMIESQAGDSFTAKFESLVTRCVWELPKREEELKRINKQIDQKRKDLQRITEKIRDIEVNTNQLHYSLDNYKKQAQNATKQLEKIMKDM